jgi:hypothetical protein
MFIIVGDKELLRDESCTFPPSVQLIVVYFFAKHAANGRKVHLQNYLGMPHVFLIFEKHPSTVKCYEEMAKFIKKVAKGDKVESRMDVVNGKGVIEVQPIDLERYSIDFSKAQVESQLPSVNHSFLNEWKKLFRKNAPGSRHSLPVEIRY